MSTDVPPRADEHVADATNELAAEFHGVLTRALVTALVLDARRDLEGRVAPEAIAETLRQLARHRLNVVCKSSQSRT